MNTTTFGAIAAAGLAAGGAASCFVGDAEGLLRPPGAKDEDDFRARCIKCGRCLEACPYQAIRMVKGPLGSEAGTPMIDARAQACRLCADFPCIAACPTEALHPVGERSEVRMGCAVIKRDLCIAVQGMRCEVCYRACPFIDSAITIDASVREGDAIHAVFEPLIDLEKCVGCGLCVQRCVVSEPEVAIGIVRDYDEARRRIDEEQAKQVSNPWKG
ncbi:4Fe-4S dicluster domain-containing protein [Slackia sp.]